MNATQRFFSTNRAISIVLGVRSELTISDVYVRHRWFTDKCVGLQVEIMRDEFANTRCRGFEVEIFSIR
jgi:hypothetical protein